MIAVSCWLWWELVVCMSVDGLVVEGMETADVASLATHMRGMLRSDLDVYVKGKVDARVGEVFISRKQEQNMIILFDRVYL